MKPNHPILDRIMPYLMLVFVIFMMIIGFFIFSYILIAAVIIGLVLFVIGYVRVKFFSRGKTQTTVVSEEIFIVHNQSKPDDAKKSGRVIEHDDQ